MEALEARPERECPVPCRIGSCLAVLEAGIGPLQGPLGVFAGKNSPRGQSWHALLKVSPATLLLPDSGGPAPASRRDKHPSDSDAITQAF